MTYLQHVDLVTKCPPPMTYLQHVDIGDPVTLAGCVDISDGPKRSFEGLSQFVEQRIKVLGRFLIINYSAPFVELVTILQHLKRLHLLGERLGEDEEGWRGKKWGGVEGNDKTLI